MTASVSTFLVYHISKSWIFEDPYGWIKTKMALIKQPSLKDIQRCQDVCKHAYQEQNRVTILFAATQPGEDAHRHR